jgi:hypothetical protein
MHACPKPECMHACMRACPKPQGLQHCRPSPTGMKPMGEILRRHSTTRFTDIYIYTYIIYFLNILLYYYIYIYIIFTYIYIFLLLLYYYILFYIIFTYIYIYFYYYYIIIFYIYYIYIYFGYSAAAYPPVGPGDPALVNAQDAANACCMTVLQNTLSPAYALARAMARVTAGRAVSCKRLCAESSSLVGMSCTMAFHSSNRELLAAANTCAGLFISSTAACWSGVSCMPAFWAGVAGSARGS